MMCVMYVVYMLCVCHVCVCACIDYDSIIW